MHLKRFLWRKPWLFPKVLQTTKACPACQNDRRAEVRSKRFANPYAVVALKIRFPRHRKVLYLLSINSATCFITLGTMIEKSSSRLRLTQLKAGLNKWRIAFLVFALFYAVLLVLNLSNVPMQWDEVGQLNGGLLLKLGLYDKFVGNIYYPPLFESITPVFFNIF